MSSDDPRPTMRVTSIALDRDELPAQITVVMSTEIVDRIRRDGFDLNPTHTGTRFEWTTTMPVALAARICKHFGGMPPSLDGLTSEIYECLSSLFNRFYDDGVDGYGR